MMQKEKNYELLGYQFGRYDTPEAWEKSVAEYFVGVGNYMPKCNQSYSRCGDITLIVELLSFYHLGFQMPEHAKEYPDRGFDVAVDYFCGDWWKHDKVARQVMDKKNHHKNCLDWVEPFSRGLLLGLLCERWDDLARICAWVEADIKPGEKGEDFEDELVDFYRSLAAGLRPEPMPGLEEVEAKILKSRKKRPKLLFQAWDAAHSGNQVTFDGAFLKAIQHFESTFDPASPELCSPLLWIAPHHSVVALAARRKGVQLPDLTPRQNALLITRESLGLSPK